MYLGNISVMEPVEFPDCSLSDLCNEHYGCLIGMILLWSPSRCRPTHRKGRCSRDIVIPHTSAIASLLIVYVSMRSLGAADVVSVTDFVKFSRWSSCGRNVYKSPETMISISSNKFASRPSAVHSTTISHTTPSTCKSHTLVLFTSTMDSFSSILAMKANDESSPISSTPVEEESSSSSGGCYCVIAWTRCILIHHIRISRHCSSITRTVLYPL